MVRRPRRQAAVAATVQLLGLAAVWISYELMRRVVMGSVGPATENASDLLAFERALHLDWERPIQAALGWPGPRELLAYVYWAAQDYVMPGVAIYLCVFQRARFTILRDVFIVSWVIALPIHGLYPVSPPRLVESGIGDWMHQFTIFHSARNDPSNASNPYAAIPSLHSGFALVIGLLMAASVRRRSARWFWLAWDPIVCLAVVATGNHYVLDVLSGIAIVAVAWLVVRQLPWHRPAVTPAAPAHTRARGAPA